MVPCSTLSNRPAPLLHKRSTHLAQQFPDKVAYQHKNSQVLFKLDEANGGGPHRRFPAVSARTPASIPTKIYDPGSMKASFELDNQTYQRFIRHRTCEILQPQLKPEKSTVRRNRNRIV